MKIPVVIDKLDPTAQYLVMLVVYLVLIVAFGGSLAFIGWNVFVGLCMLATAILAAFSVLEWRPHKTVMDALRGGVS